jgi:glycerophosphoryl diester phosphodiesterase
MRIPSIIAHRGASGRAPENTMAAFRRAVELGAGFIETDLQLTRDARFVTLHDKTLDRTTNGHGLVQKQSLAELQQLDAGMWYDREFMGERIPTLEEVLAFAQARDIVFYLEIKYDAAWGMHHALVAALRSAENAARTIVISFDSSTLDSLRRLDSGMMMGLLIEDGALDGVKAALQVGARQLCPRANLVTPELVKKAREVDLQIVPWTVNDPKEMRSLIAAGVNGIMTDVPDRLRAVIEDMQLKAEGKSGS